LGRVHANTFCKEPHPSAIYQPDPPPLHSFPQFADFLVFLSSRRFSGAHALGLFSNCAAVTEVPSALCRGLLFPAGIPPPEGPDAPPRVAIKAKLPFFFTERLRLFSPPSMSFVYVRMEQLSLPRFWFFRMFFQLVQGPRWFPPQTTINIA